MCQQRMLPRFYWNSGAMGAYWCCAHEEVVLNPDSITDPWGTQHYDPRNIPLWREFSLATTPHSNYELGFSSAIVSVAQLADRGDDETARAILQQVRESNRQDLGDLRTTRWRGTFTSIGNSRFAIRPIAGQSV